MELNDAVGIVAANVKVESPEHKVGVELVQISSASKGAP